MSRLRAAAWGATKMVVGETLADVLGRAAVAVLVMALIAVGVHDPNDAHFAYDTGQPVQEPDILYTQPGPHHVWILPVVATNIGERTATPAPRVLLRARDGTEFPADEVVWPSVFPGRSTAVVAVPVRVPVQVRPHVAVLINEDGKSQTMPVTSGLVAERRPTHLK
ncbi:MAG TPA: hypothetical protein VM938_13000 [Acidimicrobiales bacterium]|nr:hypothetical protein [Acidimicrobiales bacterium]